MPTRQKKEELLQEIKEKLDRANVVVLADYRGLDVAAITKLRQQLRNSGSELKVSKNTLTLKAATELGFEGLEKYL